MTRLLALLGICALMASCGPAGCSQVVIPLAMAAEPPVALVDASHDEMAGMSPIGALEAAYGAQTALGGSLRTAVAFTISCSTTAAAITSGTGFQALYCDNNSTTSVFLGGSAVGQSGLCISTDQTACPRRDMPADFGGGALFCRTAASTATLACIAGGG